LGVKVGMLKYLLSKAYNKGLDRIPGLVPLYIYIYDKFVSDGTIEVEANGFKMLTYKKDWAITPVLYSTHTWEPEETKIIKRLVREGMVFIDIGAHIGYYTLLASRLVGPTGKVYAFEPQERVFKLLLRNIEMNNCSNVVSIPKAISDKGGEVDIYQTKKAGFASVSTTKFKGGILIGKVGMVTLDSYNLDVDFIKLDIEGGEYPALKGMENTIKNNNVTLMVEFCPDRLKSAGTPPMEILNFLLSYFDISLITRKGLAEYRSMSQFDSIEKRGYINLLCIKKQ
jgi:FkbM family methyltransferase